MSQYPYAQPGQMPPGSPYPAVRPPSGSMYWWLFALSYVPIPGFNSLVMVVAELVVRGKAKRSGIEIVEANSRHALNWSLTWFSILPVTVITARVLTWVTSNPPPNWVIVVSILMIGLYMLGGVVTFVYMIMGGIQGKDKVVRCPLAIPFVRAPR